MPGIYYAPYGTQWGTFVEPFGGNCGPWPLGHRLILPDGRVYRHALNDGTAEVAGRLYQAVGLVANHNNRTFVAAAVGATQVGLNVGATAAAIDIYSEGIVHVNDAGADTTTEGYAWRIKRANQNGDAHLAAAGSDVLLLNLAAGEAVQVALTANSEGSASRNRFHQVAIHPSPPTAEVAGVSPGVAAADRYYWSQVGGPAAVLVEGTLVAGLSAMASQTTDGAVGPFVQTEAAPPTELAPIVGFVVKINATTEEGLIQLMLDH